jgi:predicted metal-dependent hydrolase
MTTDTHTVSIGGFQVSVVRKPIKNLHLGVYPPDGRVRVAAPMRISDAAVRVAVVGKLRWIKRQRASFERQARESEHELVRGESHYYLGRRYRLALIETEGKSEVVLRGHKLQLHVRPGQTPEQREAVLRRWYRDRLREQVAPLIEHWQAALGVKLADWGIKRMKTKWGSCTEKARRIWLNLELAKKPPECIEYLVVHELVHLLVRHHDDRFFALMDRHLPRWRAVRKTLNAAPLANEIWDY